MGRVVHGTARSDWNAIPKLDNHHLVDDLPRTVGRIGESVVGTVYMPQGRAQDRELGMQRFG